LKSFQYFVNDEYDELIKLGGQNVPCFSKEKFEKKFPYQEDIRIVGEILDEQDQLSEIPADNGKAQRILNIADDSFSVKKYNTENRLFKFDKYYIQVSEDSFVVVLGSRVLPLLLLALVFLTVVLFISFMISNNGSDITHTQTDATTNATEQGGTKSTEDATKETKPDIEPIEKADFTVSGFVVCDGEKIADAIVTIVSGDSIIGQTLTDANGSFVLEDIPDGLYQLIIEKDSRRVTYGYIIQKDILNETFELPIGDVQAIVKSKNKFTPAISVNNLNEEAELLAADLEEGQELYLTLNVDVIDNPPEEEALLIRENSGEMTLTFFDMNLIKEVLAVSKDPIITQLYQTSNVLEIIVPYDSSKDLDTRVFRYHSGEVKVFDTLSDRPTGNFQDGTVFMTSSYICIYTNKFSTYAIGSASSNTVRKGDVVMSYSDKVTLSLETEKIAVQFALSSLSTHNALVQVQIKGKDNNYTIGKSGIVTPGMQVSRVDLLQDMKAYLKAGTYEGLLFVQYLDEKGNAMDTQASLPVTIFVKK